MDQQVNRRNNQQQRGLQTYSLPEPVGPEQAFVKALLLRVNAQLESELGQPGNRRVPINRPAVRRSVLAIMGMAQLSSSPYINPYDFQPYALKIRSFDDTLQPTETLDLLLSRIIDMEVFDAKSIVLSYNHPLEDAETRYSIMFSEPVYQLYWLACFRQLLGVRLVYNLDSIGVKIELATAHRLPTVLRFVNMNDVDLIQHYHPFPTPGLVCRTRFEPRLDSPHQYSFEYPIEEDQAVVRQLPGFLYHPDNNNS